jgi:hypothetical protein
VAHHAADGILSAAYGSAGHGKNDWAAAKPRRGKQVEIEVSGVRADFIELEKLKKNRTASYVVNSTQDLPDADPSDGACATTSPGTPVCTLRAAGAEPALSVLDVAAHAAEQESDEPQLKRSIEP